MDLNDLNLSNPVLLGFYDPFNVYPLIKEDLDAKFPLTNLHWKYQASERLQSIPLLPIKLVEEVPKQSVVAENDNIYLRVMFVKYENLDMYRSQVRPLIKEWLKKLLSGSHAEWMIIMYIPSLFKDKNSTLIKTSVFDKLKNDFGAEGKELSGLGVTQESRERCFRLRENYENSIDKLEAYNVIISQFKILLLESFTNKYELLTESLEKESDKELKHFHLKLKLADLLSDMKLSQDSLNVFDDIWDLLNVLKSVHSDSFDCSLESIPLNLDEYHFESSLLEKNSDLVYGPFREKFNLFELKCFIFINQSILLQSLANFAQTISISTIHISKLFHKLLVFLDDMSLSFGDSLDEYLYVVIDNYLNLPICSKLVEVNNKNNATNNTNVVLREIFESRAELRLYQRSKLITIASTEGYYIEGIRISMSNVSLDDDKTPSKIEKRWNYSPLANILKDKDSYYKALEEITESIILDLVNSNRAKTVDVLSVDLALLNYQKGNYKEALDILQDSHDFFLSNGWNFMGGFILEAYLDCIKKTSKDDNELILISYLKLFTTFASKGEKVGINEYGLTKEKDYPQKIFEEIRKYSSLLDKEIAFPLSKLFDYERDVYIEHNKETSLNKSVLRLKIRNLLGTALTFKRIKVELRNSVEKCIPFELENVLLKPDDDIITLQTNHLYEGFFRLSNVQFQVNDSLKFVDQYDIHDKAKNTNNDITVLKNNQNSFLVDSTLQTSVLVEEMPVSKNIHCYQDFTKLWCDFSKPFDIELGFTEILFCIRNGSSKIQNLSFSLSSSTSGLTFDIDESATTIPEIGENESSNLKIPYKYFGNSNLLNFAVELTYTSNGETFYHSIEKNVDTSLIISVSVQDIFNSSFIFSKFQIGPVIPKSPIKVVTVDLFSGNDNFEIGKPNHIPKNLILFDDQYASFMFSLTPHPDYNLKPSDNSDLEVGYVDLREECENILDAACIEHLSKIGLLDTWLLFKPLIREIVRFDLDQYVMNNTLEILNKEEAMEKLTVLLFGSIKEEESRLKLKEAFAESFDVIGKNHPVFEVLRKLHIEVPIPILDFLHIVEFNYSKNTHFVVGNPITMKLHVRVITRWSVKDDPDAANKSDLTVLAESSPNNSMSVVPPSVAKFQISIQSDDNWLLSGFRKYIYSLEEPNEEKSLSFEVTLIPLNVGKVLLPKVNIKSMQQSDDSPTMDTVVKNGSESILVVPELDSITFSF